MTWLDLEERRLRFWRAAFVCRVSRSKQRLERCEVLLSAALTWWKRGQPFQLGIEHISISVDWLKIYSLPAVIMLTKGLKWLPGQSDESATLGKNSVWTTGDSAGAGEEMVLEEPGRGLIHMLTISRNMKTLLNGYSPPKTECGVMIYSPLKWQHAHLCCSTSGRWSPS